MGAINQPKRYSTMKGRDRARKNWRKCIRPRNRLLHSNKKTTKIWRWPRKSRERTRRDSREAWKRAGPLGGRWKRCSVNIANAEPNCRSSLPLHRAEIDRINSGSELAPSSWKSSRPAPRHRRQLFLFVLLHRRFLPLVPSLDHASLPFLYLLSSGKTWTFASSFPPSRTRYLD